MKRGAFLAALLLGVVLGLQGVGAAELRWEIERNFRYFLYPSDVEIQRVARDIYETQNKEPPNVEQLETLLNGKPGFWSTRLSAADNAHRKRWPSNWPSGENLTVYDLLRFLRRQEGRPSLNSILCPPASLQGCVEAEELGRLGWASLLVEPYSGQIPTGSTDTCWQPLNRLHSNCNRLWGDYVRPEGWIVRVYAPDAPPGAKCDWSVTGAAFADDDIFHFKANLKAALHLKPDEKQDRHNVACETRIVVPSDNNGTSVAGTARVEWTLNETGQTPLDVAPADRLIVGLGDSFTSGEGDPERPPWFNNEGSGDAALPVRQSDLIPGKPAFDTRAQWTDRWCHRSVYSWQIRSALDLALRDPHHSVTVLPYGCAGASILGGLLSPYKEPEWASTDLPPGGTIAGSRIEIQLAYQELCKSFVGAACPRRPTGSSPFWCGWQNTPDIVTLNDVKPISQCSPRQNVFRRNADALLLDIGINDVEFANWVLGLILDDGILDAATTFGMPGYVPCLDAAANPCGGTRTAAKFDRLQKRYLLLSDLLLHRLLPDFGIKPENVIVAQYPPELSGCGGAEKERVSGNLGLTVATFPCAFCQPELCQNGIAGAGFGSGGAIAAVRKAEDTRKVELGRNRLNQDLKDFMSRFEGASLISWVDSAPGPNDDDLSFFHRGFCRSEGRFNTPPNDHLCFDVQDLQNIDCESPPDPESMHVPRSTHDCATPANFRPFGPNQFEPYRHRVRLFRTMNDVYIGENQRPNKAQYGKFGPIDLISPVSGGAFHPTAEAHSIVATFASKELWARFKDPQ
jgi:hypothetical protein